MSSIPPNLELLTNSRLRDLLDKAGLHNNRTKTKPELVKILKSYLAGDPKSSVLEELHSVMHFQAASGTPAQNGSRILSMPQLPHPPQSSSNVQRILGSDTSRGNPSVFVSQASLSAAPHNLTYSNLNVSAPIRITPQNSNGMLYQPTATSLFNRGAPQQTPTQPASTHLAFSSSANPRQPSSSAQPSHYPLGAVNYGTPMNNPRSMSVNLPSCHSIGNSARRAPAPQSAISRPGTRQVVAIKPPTGRDAHGQPSGLIALPMENGTFAKLQYQQPHLQFTNCVFYDHKSRLTSTLVEPSILFKDNFTNEVKQHLTTHRTIELDDEKAGAIMKCCVREADPVEFGLQVIARFCMINPHEVDPNTGLLLNSNVEDCLPPHLNISLNDQNLPLHCILPNNKPYMDGRRSPKPINLTSLLNFDSMRQPNSGHRVSSTRSNLLRISWVHYLPLHQYYAVGVYFAFRNQYTDLARDLQISRVLSEEYMKSIIQRRLGGRTSNGDDDCIAVTNDLLISLKCPLLQSRIRIPVRTKACTHLQSFCLYNYLTMNDNKVFWKCSLCKQAAKFDDLYVDNFLLNILRNPLTASSDHVVYRPDGSWAVPTATEDESPKADETASSSHSTEKTPAVPPNPPVAPQKPPPPPPALQPPSSEELVIDLISSDEEDSVAVPKKAASNAPDPQTQSGAKGSTPLTNGVRNNETAAGTLSSESGRLKRKASEAPTDFVASEIDSASIQKRPLLSVSEVKESILSVSSATSQSVAKVNDLLIIISDSDDDETEPEKQAPPKITDPSQQNSVKSGASLVDKDLSSRSSNSSTQSAVNVTARSITPSVTTLSTSTSVINSTTASTPSNNPKAGTLGSLTSMSNTSVISGSTTSSSAVRKETCSNSSSAVDGGKTSSSNFVTTTTTTTPVLIGSGKPTTTSSSTTSRAPLFSELADRNPVPKWYVGQIGQIRRSAEGSNSSVSETESKSRRLRQ